MKSPGYSMTPDQSGWTPPGCDSALRPLALSPLTSRSPRTLSSSGEGRRSAERRGGVDPLRLTPHVSRPHAPTSAARPSCAWRGTSGSTTWRTVVRASCAPCSRTWISASAIGSIAADHRPVLPVGGEEGAGLTDRTAQRETLVEPLLNQRAEIDRLAAVAVGMVAGGADVALQRPVAHLAGRYPAEFGELCLRQREAGPERAAIWRSQCGGLHRSLLACLRRGLPVQKRRGSDKAARNQRGVSILRGRITGHCAARCIPRTGNSGPPPPPLTLVPTNFPPSSTSLVHGQRRTRGLS